MGCRLVGQAMWWFHENNAKLWLHLASWDLLDSQPSWESKMEQSVAINSIWNSCWGSLGPNIKSMMKNRHPMLISRSLFHLLQGVLKKQKKIPLIFNAWNSKHYIQCLKSDITPWQKPWSMRGWIPLIKLKKIAEFSCLHRVSKEKHNIKGDF